MQFEQAKVLVDSLLHEQMQVALNLGKPMELALATAPLVHIYPNPVSDRATIKVISNPGLVSTIAIYNNFGEKVVNIPVNNNTNVVNMLLSFQQYQHGLYFCVVTTEKGSYAYKFLVAPVK